MVGHPRLLTDSDLRRKDFCFDETSPTRNGNGPVYGDDTTEVSRDPPRLKVEVKGSGGKDWTKEKKRVQRRYSKRKGTVRCLKGLKSPRLYLRSPCPWDRLDQNIGIKVVLRIVYHPDGVYKPLKILEPRGSWTSNHVVDTTPVLSGRWKRKGSRRTSTHKSIR